MLIRILISAALLILFRFLPAEGALRFGLYLIPYLVIGYDILWKAIKGIKNRQVFDECFLMAIATVGAIALAVEPSRAGVIEGAAGKALGAVKLERLVRLHAGEGVAHVELVGVAYVDRRVETELLPRR